MRAMIIKSYGGPEVLGMRTDFPEPVPKDGSGAEEVLVRVEATGVNRMDILVRNGYPGLTTPLPHICGADIAGTLAQTGERVVIYPLLSCGTCAMCRAGRTNLCLNWRSIGLHEKGGYAEYVSVPRKNVFTLPAEISYDEAVALPVAGLTAYHALKTVANVQKGDTVFVWGGAGILGSMAVQIARAAGARVISAASSDERVEVLRQLGADVAINRERENILERVAAETDGGVDIVLDPIGQATMAQSLEMLTNGGRLLLCGILGGKIAEINIHLTYYHHRSIHGLFLGTRDDMAEVIRLVAGRSVIPLIDSVRPLSEAAEAHRKLESGNNTGKMVLRI
ncbi:MAG TPA: zinc-binding dehydrogenase [Spirochaetia bacterium]|nr:zinc-binding dehydrogenase [Spirochaetia bacterium]